ncbi:Uncharacterised protein [Mycobacteroides abscessus subsp. abscessus]|nr:Uncharacterised protein [Mycobacteroides abscessus subsp. abscessus]
MLAHLLTNPYIPPFNIDEFNIQEYVTNMETEIRELTGEQFSAKVVDETKVVMTTVTPENEITEIIVDSETSEVTIDGQELGPIIETNVTLEKDISSLTNSSSLSLSLSSSWDPIYQYTITHTISKVAGDLSRAAVYGVLLITAVAAIFSGLGITSGVLLSNAKTFLASYGFALSTTLMGDILNGKWSYQVYRTRNLVPTGYGSYQYAYRYQNGRFTANFKIGNFTSPTWTVKGRTGNWWFASKPF